MVRRQLEEGSGGGRLPRRLKGVRKRNRAQRGIECEAVMQKLRLAKIKGRGGR